MAPALGRNANKRILMTVHDSELREALSDIAKLARKALGEEAAR